MPLSLNEIRDRATAFAREWQGESSERAKAQSFRNEFFQVFGVNRRRIAAVDAAYGVRNFATQAVRVAFLFEFYARESAPPDAAPKRRAPPHRAPAAV